MKKFYSALVACALLAVAQGCTKEDDSVVEFTFNSCFTYVQNASEGSFNETGYVLKLNYTTGTADLVINNLVGPDGLSFGKVEVGGMPWKIDKGWIVASGKNIKGNSKVTFDNLDVRIFGRSDLHPGLSISYSANGDFKGLASHNAQLLFGKTVSSSPALGAYENTDTYYTFVIDTKNQTADITLYGAKFIDRMPAMDITLPGVPFTIKDTRAEWSVDAITPVSGGTPYESFPITNLKGEFDFGGNYTMEFDCTPSTMGGMLFHITTDCSFDSMPGQGVQAN